MRNRVLILMAALAVLAAQPESAHGFASNFDMSGGFTSIDVVAGKGFDQTLESLTTVDVHYNVYFGNINSAATIDFSELVETDFGTLAFTRFALGWRWYPFGLNGERKLVDNEVEGKFWNSKPFIETTVGLTSLSIDSSDVSNQDFNAALIDFAPGIGLEIPFGTDFLLLGQIRTLFSMNALNSGSDNPLSAVEYSGFQVMLGFRVTPF